MFLNIFIWINIRLGIYSSVNNDHIYKDQPNANTL